MNIDLTNPTLFNEDARILEGYLASFATKLKGAIAHPPGKTAKSQQWNQADAAARLAEIERARAELGARTSLWIGKNIPKAMATGIRSGYWQAKNSGVVTPQMAVQANMTAAFKGTFSRADIEAAKVLAQHTAADLQSAALLSTRRCREAIKKIAAKGLSNGQVNEILATGFLSGDKDQAYRTLRDQLAAIHGKQITIKDKNGRDMEWDTDTYARMVAVTRMREAAEEARHRKLVDLGIDLVVIVGPISDDFCADYVNLVFSLSGSSSKYPALSSAAGGGPPFHPNCRHSTQPFIEELATDAQKDAAEMDADQRATLGMSAAQAQKAYQDTQGRQQRLAAQKNVVESIGGTFTAPTASDRARGRIK